MREKIARFMQGRYGNDELNRFILYVALAIIIANFFIKNAILSWVEMAILIVCILRTFSKNYSARSRENQKFLAIKDKLFGKFGRKNGSGNSYRQQYNNQYQQRNSAYNSANAAYKIFKCPKCGQKIRVPSGKGKIEISCPKCQNRFIKKS